MHLSREGFIIFFGLICLKENRQRKGGFEGKAIKKMKVGSLRGNYDLSID